MQYIPVRCQEGWDDFLRAEKYVLETPITVYFVVPEGPQVVPDTTSSTTVSILTTG